MGMGSFNIRGLEQLRDRIGRMDYDRFMRKTAMQLAQRLIALTKEKTPTITGNLKRNWNMGTVEKIGNEYIITVNNNLDYASFVEYGHRNKSHTKWVRGQYMLTVSEEELKREAPAIIQRRMEAFLREVFHD